MLHRRAAPNLRKDMKLPVRLILRATTLAMSVTLLLPVALPLVRLALFMI